jgi:hypothetical protein
MMSLSDGSIADEKRLHEVLDGHDGDARPAHATDHCDHHVHAVRREAGERLVEEHHAGRRGQAARTLA